MTQLIKYEAACRALAECKAVDEVKTLHDKAAAMQAYGRMAKDKTLEVDAAEIRIRAERRLGEMLAAQKAEGGLSKGGRPAELTGSKSEPVSEVATLADAGIDKKLSSRAQKLAAVPEAEFEAEVTEFRERVSKEGARVSARLEVAGDKAMKKKPVLQVIEGGKDAAELEALRAERDELADRLAEMAGDLEAYMKASEGNHEAALEIKRLVALRKTAESQRDDYMNKCVEMLKQIKSLQRALGRYEKASA